MKRITTIIFGLSLIFIIILLLLKQKKENDFKSLVQKYNNHEIEWKSKDKKTTIPIKFDDSGRILIKVKIENKDIGYLLFDTGFAITNLSKELDNFSKDSGDSNQIMDGWGKIQNQNVRILNRLSIGDINIKSLKYNSDHYNNFSKDSIIGILGVNVIKHFYWDIDMVNEKIIISSKKTKDFVDSTYQAIKLLERFWTYEISIKVNNSNKYAMLDTGFNGILILKDSIIDISKKYYYNTNDIIEGKAVFSKKENRSTFASLKIGNYTIKDAMTVYGNTESPRNFLGISLFHSFQRIILNFEQKKIILIDPVEKEGIHHPNSLSTRMRKKYKEKVE
jgi:predicted aspartyl protease